MKLPIKDQDIIIAATQFHNMIIVITQMGYVYQITEDSRGHWIVREV